MYEFKKNTFFIVMGVLRGECPLRLQIMSTITKLLGFVR